MRGEYIFGGRNVPYFPRRIFKQAWLLSVILVLPLAVQEATDQQAEGSAEAGFNANRHGGRERRGTG